MRAVRALLIWFVPACGFVAAFLLLLSPWVRDRLSMDDTVRVQARVLPCAPHRDGIGHRSAIVCRFQYSHEGKAYEAESPAWDSQSPLLTSAGLARASERQAARVSRPADVPHRDPGRARLADERPLVMPPLWLWLLGLFIAMAVVAIRLDPSGIPYRRAELAPDPVTGHLMPIDTRRRDRLRRRIAGQCLAGGVSMAICLLGLSNQPADRIARAGMSALQPVPARLVGCAHRHHGGNKGHHQIDCGFTYSAGGRKRTGQAESLDFRLFPTGARMDAEVARLPDGTPVVAYVDRRYPDYAWAPIRQGIFVPFTWGLFELQLWIVLLAIAAGLIASVPRWRDPAGRLD